MHEAAMWQAGITDENKAGRLSESASPACKKCMMQGGLLPIQQRRCQEI
jgi:hypothetical protein